MANGWTLDRRRRQAAAIQRWKPWERATGPRTPLGKGISRMNAFKGGERQWLRGVARLLAARAFRLVHGTDTTA